MRPAARYTLIALLHFAGGAAICTGVSLALLWHAKDAPAPGYGPKVMWGARQWKSSPGGAFGVTYVNSEILSGHLKVGKPPWWSAARGEEPDHPPTISGHGRMSFMLEGVCGWPLPCLYSAARVWPTGKGYFFRAIEPIAGGLRIERELEGGEFSPEELGPLVRKPPRILWLGALGNTLIFTAGLGLLTGANAARRRFTARRRLSAKLCPKCGYPLGSDGLCAECGRRSGNTGVIGSDAAAG